MLDVGRKVLNVGLAQTVKKGSSAYSPSSNLSIRLKRMVQEVQLMELIIFQSDVKTLLLQSDKIKKLYPRYHIVLKDDWCFPHQEIHVQSE